MILAAGTAEGRVYTFTRNPADGSWQKLDFIAHGEGVNGLSWGPSTEPAPLAAKASSKYSLPNKRLCTGGNDKMVKVWEFRGEGSPSETVVGQHEDWVRDVAWCSSIGLQHDMIASCSEDKTCRVWTHADKNGWTEKRLSFGGNVPLYQVSWSQVGNLLAVSGGDNQVHVMAEDTDGNWKET